MINCAIPACETQNFASLLRGYAFVGGGLLCVYVDMGCSGDARFCVSTGGTQLRRKGGDGKCAEDTGMHGYAVQAVKNLYIIK